MKNTKFYNIKVDKLTEDEFPALMSIGKKLFINKDPKLIQGEELITDIKEEDGLRYSVVLSGERYGSKEREVIGYIVAIDEKINKDELSICLEDFAIIPEAQRQGLGWKIMKQFIEKLKGVVEREDRPTFLYMYLRENSKSFMDKHQKLLQEMGVELVKETIIGDYYGTGKNATHQLYELRN